MAHTTGACEWLGKKGYHKSHLLATATRAVVINNDDNKEKPPTKKSNSSTKVEVMTAMMEQCEMMEKEKDDPDQANFAGMMGAFMKSMMK